MEDIEGVIDTPLLVLGNLNTKAKDRTLTREELRPVQLIRADGVHHIESLQNIGDVGINGLTWTDEDPLVFYFSTGSNLNYLDLTSGEIREIGLNRLGDTHEIDVYDGLIWISNTDFDEIVAVNPARKEETKRISLDSFREDSSSLEAEGENEPERVKEESHFHCNQVFRNLDGDLCATVHHVSGRQVKRFYPNRVLKNQGDGGIINLEKGEKQELRLKCPHTVSVLEGEYWIFDSGNFKIKVYDDQWVLQDTIDTLGYGRGAAVGEGGCLYAGISKARKRYLKFLPVEASEICRVQVFDTETLEAIGDIEIPAIEQVSNVYSISDEQAEALLSLEEG